MQLKFILRRDNGTRAQVAVTADATASVGDLAQALVTGDPEGTRSGQFDGLTLKLEQASFDTGASGRLLDPARSLIDSGMRSGSTVSVVPAQAAPPRTRRGRSVAVLRVLDGPDIGREFSLPPGNSVIGTGARCDVRLRDRGVAEVHAAVSVGESIEISNLAGPSAVLLGGHAVQRAVVSSADVVQLAGTSMAFLHTVRPGTTQTDSAAIEFNRSPRVVARFGERTFPAPKLPQPPEPAHFPIVSMLLPLVMGVILFAVTRNMLTVVFIALSPLLMVGMYIDAKYQAKKKHDREVQRFAKAQRQLAADLTSAQQVERAVRRGEAPALAEVVESIHRLGPLLWTHRPEHPEFLSIRIGLGDAPSRCRVDVSGEQDGEAQYLQQLADLRHEFAQISDVPLVADLRECGALGVCGPRSVVDGVARAIVMQLIGLHSPSELTITAFSSQQSRTSWEWLEWLPHAGSVHSPLAGNHLTDSENGGIALLARLEDLLKQRSDEQSAASAPCFGAIAEDAAAGEQTRAPLRLPAVIVLVEDTAPIDRSRLTRLAERGPSVGIHVIWVAAQVSSVPAACRTFVLVESEAAGSTLGEVRHGIHSYPVACDAIDVPDAKQIALLLAPVVDVGAAVEDATDLPRSVSYLSLSGTALANDPGAVTRLWLSNDSVTPRGGTVRQPSTKPGSLRALVGSTGVQDFYLDLREHGPHALVGGTTGAGKSEFLQSWMLGMATAHSPDRLTFLLIDYKGGTAFAECAQLPHTVGLVTDLSPHLVRRALTSLRAEIRRREEILNKKGAKSLVELEQRGDPDAPPSLVIIVDEFAALVTDVPEFIDGVVDVAQRGRSLGLHLVLATQRPAGVIKDNLRANTNLRIALRLNDVDDSLDVIDDPLAAHFPPELPGRAAAKTGPGRLTTFQTGYVSGWSGDQPDQSPIDIWEFVFGRRRPWLTQVARTAAPVGPTDIARVVDTVRTASDLLLVPPPRKPWLPELRATYALESLPRSPKQLVLGCEDLPGQQRQPVAVFAPEDGHLAIIGTSGSGKSTALRTLAVSAALTDDGPTHVYAFDFASGSLQMLEVLPHVAAVVDGDDDERIGRVLRRLVAMLEDRARKFARANASNLSGYQHSVDPTEARVLLFIDGIGAFRDAYEHLGHSANFAMFSQIVTDGRRLGLNVVVTADRPGALSSSLGSMMQSRLTLRLASVDDYVMANVPSDILSINSPSGRGIVGRNEVQVAVFGGDESVAVQAQSIAGLARRMHEQGYREPEPVQRLSDHVSLESLPATTESGDPVIGVADETLAPACITPRGVFMVAGPPGSGRTTALVTLAQALRRSEPTAQIVHMAAARSAIGSLAVWSRSVTGSSAVLDFAYEVSSTVGQPRTSTLMLVIESIADFTNSEAESELVRLIKALADSSAFVVGEAEVSAWGQAWNLAPPFKAARRGLLLSPGGVEADTLLSTPIGTIRRHDFPPGRGVLVEKGKGVWLQIAQPVV